jgi:hypothetical protein
LNIVVSANINFGSAVARCAIAFCAELQISVIFAKLGEITRFSPSTTPKIHVLAGFREIVTP